MISKEEIREWVRVFLAEAIKDRRHFHAYPELSFQEEKTAAYIRRTLENLGIPYERKANTGTVAIIRGEKSTSNKVVALRADIDALPIRELNEVAYKSKNEGIMHACGHDIHAAIVLTVAKILSKIRDRFSGTVKFIFQPAEERIPGGAKQMIVEGALADPIPDSILGQHTMPELPVGKIGFRSGNYMASSDELYITIKGKGGHGAMPHLTIDPVAIMVQVISTLQQLVSRKTNPLVPAVLSFGRIIADGAANVIPDEVKIEGTFRTLDEDWRHQAHQEMERMVFSLVKGMGGTVDFEWRSGYPVLTNNRKLTEKMKEYAIEFLGKENVVDLDLWMASEDFAYFAQEVPACYYRLGVAPKDREITGLHTPTFLPSEGTLEKGIGLLLHLTLMSLK